MTDQFIAQAQNHIAEIRREQRGHDGAAQRPRGRKERALQGALRKLADELNAKRPHFLLELIQNAEDNEYPSGVEAVLEFHLVGDDPTESGGDGCLCVLNNETGFGVPNVESICSVGESTKTKREGYIGEKGIGFKSVFLASDRPHIFSPPYRFRFSRHEDDEVGFGFIVPTWIADVPSMVADSGKQTAILLPLQTGVREEIANGLRQIAPETILFLRRLRALTVWDVSSNWRVEIAREQAGGRLVRLRSNESERLYLVSALSFHRPPDLREEKREGIEDRDVVVAFPLISPDHSESRVFAYLPTEAATGLPFIVNGDFLLTASREAIFPDRKWNLWLRDCVANVFLDGYGELLRDARWKRDACRFIPVVRDLKELQEFFSVVVASIQAKLRISKSVAVITTEELVLPESARLASQTERSLLPVDDIPVTFRDIHLVLPEWEKEPERLKSIGVSDLSIRELIRVFNDAEWTLRRDDKWFETIFGFLGKRSIKSGTMEAVPCIPTQDGRCLAPQSGPVFLPPADSQDAELADLSHLENEARPVFLRASLADLLSADEATFTWVSRTLNVRKFSVAEFIVDALLPNLIRERERLTADRIVVATNIIRAHATALTKDQLGKAKARLPLLLDDGAIVLWGELDGKTLVVPRTVDPRTGWSAVFREPEDIPHLAVLSNAYLTGADRAARESWSELFELLAVTTTPPPYRRKVYSNDRSSASDFERQSFIKHVEYSNYVSHLTNVVPPRWLARLRRGQSEAGDHGSANALLKWLSGQSKFSLRSSLGGLYSWTHYSLKHKAVVSEFEDCLQNAAWFPSTKGLVSPGEVFVDRPETRELFGNRVPYTTKKLGDEHARLLGVHSQVTSEQLLDYLEKLSASDRASQSVTVLVKIYRRLRDSATPAQLHDKRIIFLPGDSKPWRIPSEVIWEDAVAVCGGLFGYLEPTYGRHDLRTFFVTKLGVAPFAATREYANAWVRLSAAEPGEPLAIEAALEKIYATMLGEIASPNEWPDWWHEFRGQARLWTQSDCFHPPNDVFVPDDGELKALFRYAIEFAWIPAKRSFGEFDRFFREFDSPRLSESVEVSLEDADLAEPVESAVMLTPGSKRLIFTWLWNQLPDDLKELVESGRMERLIASVEKGSAAILLKYRLKARAFVPAAREHRLAFWDEENRVLYLAHEADPEALRQEVAEALVRALWGGRNLKDLVPKVFELLCASQERAERLCTKRDWTLPAERGAWFRARLEQGCEPVIEEPPVESLPPPITPTTTKSKSSGTRTGGNGPSEPPSPPHTPTKPSTQRPPTHSAAQTRRISYIAPIAPEPRDAASDETTEEQRALGRAAEEFVVRYEKDPDKTKPPRNAERMPTNHPGYDVESRGTTEEDIRYIEVKGLAGAWGAAGVSMTSRQMREARDRREAYWLYVVEYAGGPSPKLHRFRNPAALIDSYHLDEKWREVRAADSSTGADGTFVEGARVLVDGRPATFVAIVGGTTSAFRVRYDDGEEAIILSRARLAVASDEPSST